MDEMRYIDIKTLIYAVSCLYTKKKRKRKHVPRREDRKNPQSQRKRNGQGLPLHDAVLTPVSLMQCGNMCLFKCVSFA